MQAADDIPVNHRKMSQLRETVEAVLAEVLRRGFHGVAAVELCVHDGAIQWIRRKIEKVEK